ncbi:MAG: maleylpyruvate isomerase N-terminal domain-containing protein [Vicinamibacteria bacterium]
MVTKADHAAIVALIAELDDAGHALLAGLPAAAWLRPVAPGGWRVRDGAAHLVDGAARRLSFGRDALTPSPPPWPINGPGDLTRFLDELNATWVRASERLSPRVLTDLVALTSRDLAAYLRTLDPESPALFPVAWAGDAASATWFDVAREYTERWHHWMQIREAVGAPLAHDARWLAPLIGTAVYALPNGYRDVEAPEGTSVGLAVTGPGGGRWVLARRGNGWRLSADAAERADASVTMADDTAWRLFFKMLPPAEAARRAAVRGEPALTAPLFTTLALMATPAAPRATGQAGAPSQAPAASVGDAGMPGTRPDASS